MQYLQFIVVACAALLANCAGGMFARRITDGKHLAIGFSAGTVIAAAFLIFLPHALLSGRGAYGVNELLQLVALGFVFALLLDRFGSLWITGRKPHEGAHRHYAHAALNGAAIGIAYQVSPAVSGIVAAALLAHEFSDSADAMSRAPREHRQRLDLREYSMSSLCFAASLAATCFYSPTPARLCVALALFGGYFIYLSASELIPESHHTHPQLLTVGMTFGGAGVLYLASYAVGQ